MVTSTFASKSSFQTGFGKIFGFVHVRYDNFEINIDIRTDFRLSIKISKNVNCANEIVIEGSQVNKIGILSIIIKIREKSSKSTKKSQHFL